MWNMNRGQNSFTLYQTYTLSLKTKQLTGDHHEGGVVHPRHQTPQGESVVKPEAVLLMILTLVCESDIKEVRGNIFPLFIK